MLLSDSERQQFRLEPTPAVVQAARDTIRKHEGAIEELEGHIQGLVDQIRHLRYDQAKHRAKIERCHGLITLARRLPEELLIKIFRHCVDGGWTRAPVVVSHVCSAWRRAAQAPVLWSHIYARCDDPNVLERMRFWLKMARGVELHITVTASRRTPRWQVEHVMAPLKAHSGQWGSLRIETASLQHAGLIMAQCDGIMPVLRTLEFYTEMADVDDAFGVTDLTQLPETFGQNQAPRLRTVTYISNIIPAVPVFPTHITGLTLEVRESPEERPLSAAMIMEVLEPLVELRNLTFTMPLNYEQPYVPEGDPERVVSLPNLTTLTLYGPTDLNGLLTHLHAPSLCNLHLRSLEDAGYRQQPIGPSLTRFLEQSAPPLALLELHDIDLTPETFATVFAALPRLRELRLHESSISDGTLALLNGPRGLCPRLARVDLRWCGLLHGRALVDLVRSRLVVDDLAGTVSDPIVEVGVINCCFVEEGDVLDLARMTVCRIITRGGDDHCRECFLCREVRHADGLGFAGVRDCCSNGRYRTRFRLRHMAELLEREGDFRLVL